MSTFSSYKKIFLLVFTIAILVAIPFSVYIAQKRQQTTTKAAASTVLSLEPSSTTLKQNETLTLNITLNPGSGTSANQVSFVRLAISFDASKFTTLPNSLTVNPDSSNKLTYIIDEPKYDNTAGNASISLSIGSDPTNAIKTKTKIAVLQLKAIATTTPNTSITFDSAPNTQVLSVASSDQTNENTLSTTIPATVIITAATGTTTPTNTPIPTTTSVITPITTIAPPITSTTSGQEQSPVCSSLDINGPTSGIAPYSLTFTVTGSDPDGTISKISYNFGDSIEDVTAGGGIGTSSVSGQLVHVYNAPGVYTAYATLTNNKNNLSIQQASCAKTITINSANLNGSPQPSISPLPPTGDGKIIFNLGTLGVIITIVGGALLLL